MDKQRLFYRFNRVNAKLSILFISFLCFLVGCSIDEDEEMGSLSLSLSSDFSITAVTKAEPKASVVGPSVRDFQVEVYQGEAGTVLFKKWDSFAEMTSGVNLPQNVYVLKAIFGEQHTGAFETPYYEGTTPFSIVKRKNTSVSVVCKIANTKVTLEYADGFKNYFKDWSAKVASTGDSLTFAKDETRGAYFEPGQVGMNLTMTRQDGKTITYAPPTVATEGGKHYRFRLDVTTGGAGGVNLVIKFDKTTEEKPIYVDISGDNPVIISPPYISATGFSNGMPITVTEGTSVGKMYTLVNARGNIKSCVLRTESRSLTDDGWPASVDLADASANVAALKDKIVFTSGMKGAQMAEIDFTNLIPALKASNQTTLQHTFTLEVTDETGKKNEEFMLVVQMTVPGFRLLKLENVKTDGASAEGTADVRFEMTSGDPSKIKVQAKDDYGIWSDWEWVSGKEPKLTSVANVYLGTIRIKVEDKKELRLNYNGGARISNSEYLYGGKYSFELEMADGQPADGATNPYVWATKAYVKVKDNSISPYKLSFKNGDGDILSSKVLPNETIEIKGLFSGEKNTITAFTSPSEWQSKPFEIQTEKGEQLPNSGFEYWSSEKTDVSGNAITTNLSYVYWNKWFPWSSEETKGWNTLNLKTTQYGSTPTITKWPKLPTSPYVGCCYVANSGTKPTTDSYSGKFAALIRTVGWGKDNTAPAKVIVELNKGTMTNADPGYLYLGGYLEDPENQKEFLIFSSRPNAISFQYKYFPSEGEQVSSDKFKVRVIVENRNGGNSEKLAEIEFEDGDVINKYKLIRLDLDYKNLLKKATHIYVMFKSGTENRRDYMSRPPHNNLSDGEYVGSELYIDDLKLIYE